MKICWVFMKIWIIFKSCCSLRPRGGVLGWVLDRDAQHRPLTRNATKGKKKGVETIHFDKFWQKVGVEIRHFPHFCTKIGVETIQIFQRPIKGGSKWRSICSNLHRVSTLPGTATCWKFQKIQQPYIKRYCYVFFSTNIVEILLKLRADASSGSGAFKAFLQGSSSPSPSPSPSLLFSIFVQRPKDLDNHKDTHFHKGFQAHWMWTLFKRSCRFSWA